MNQEGFPNRHFGKLLIILAIMVVIGLGGWYTSHRHNNNPAYSSPGWAHYTSKKYGFEFDYLTAWGKPTIIVNNKGSGKHYDVMFDKNPPDLTHIAKLSFDTNNATITCDHDESCETVPAITRAYIQQQMKNNTLNFVGKGVDKYAILIRLPQGTYNTDTLSMYRAQDLSKLDASAATGYYSKKVNKDCPINQLPDSGNCITPANFNDLNKAVASIRTL